MTSLLALVVWANVLTVSAGTPATNQPLNISIEQPWARASIVVSRPIAAYMTVVNASNRAVRITSVETPVATRADIHQTIVGDNTTRMKRAGVVTVPPGERVVFAPSGLHVMLIGLKQKLKKGSTFPMTINFADGSSIKVIVPIFGPGARSPKK